MGASQNWWMRNLITRKCFLPRCICIYFGVLWMWLCIIMKMYCSDDCSQLLKFPRIDRFNPDFDTKSQAEELNKLCPSIPLQYWERHRHHGMFYHNASCAALPDIFSLNFHNLYWQTFTLAPVTYQLYSASYDARRLNGAPPCVHIHAMVDDIYIQSRDVFCQLWFENLTEPVLTGPIEYNFIWNRDWRGPGLGDYAPFMLTCEIPEDTRGAPACVSLVHDPCDRATNLLSVTYVVPEKKEEFAVCIKGLDYGYVDLSVRMVEWIEFLSLMGVHKFFFYQFQTHPNIMKVLEHYKSVGKVDVKPITLPDRLPNVLGFQHDFLEHHVDIQSFNEILPYNDCFYRNIYSYEYIVLLDLDEIIVPQSGGDWHWLLDAVQARAPGGFASFSARNVYFLHDMTPAGSHPDVPTNMHMLSHSWRSSLFSPPFFYAKSFFSTNYVLTLHNHLPLTCSREVNLTYSIDLDIAQMNHYRSDCVIELNCTEYREHMVEDTLLWPFKDELIENVQRILKFLNLVGDEL